MTIALYIIGAVLGYILIGIPFYRIDYRYSRNVLGFNRSAALTGARLSWAFWPLYIIMLFFDEALPRLEKLITPNTEADRLEELEKKKREVEQLERETLDG